MKLTRSGYGLKALFVLLCFGIQHGLLDAKAIKKSKHAVHKSGSKKNNAPKGDFCVNHSYCVKYSDLDCASDWIQLNCPRMCRLCKYEGSEMMQLPAVLYIKKGAKKHGISGKRKHKNKHAFNDKVLEKRDETPGGRRDVVFLNKPYDYTPTERSPTTSYSLFDYKGNYRKWLFLYPDQHPVNMHYVDQGKAADANKQTAGQQQTGVGQDAVGMPAAGAAAPTVAPAAPAAAAQVAAPDAAQLAAPAAAPAVAQPAAPAALAAPAAPVAPNMVQPAAPAAVAPAVPVAAVPAVAQVGQVAAAVQQPVAPVAAQQPVVAQPAAAAVPLAGSQPVFTNQSQAVAPAVGNQTIELINQTVSLATNNTQQTYGAAGFEPTVANVTQTNQAAMVGAIPGNNASSQTVATGNNTLQNQSLAQSLSQNSTQTFFINESKSNESLAQLQSGAQLHLPAQQLQSFINASQLHQDEVSKESLNTSPPASLLPSSFHLSGEEVKSEHKLHVDNTDASSEMQGNLNPNGASVTLSGPGSLDVTSTGTSFTQDVTVDSDGAAQTPWTCCKKVPPPKDCKPCPKLPKAPPMPYMFNIYCDDLYKDCAYGYSNCNDTWWQINCPRRCNLCQAKDNVVTPKTKKILPSEVKNLDTSELESDLVAPVPGEKPLVAKYTLRVKPKLLNGVPQMQEIRIMPPNKSGASGFVKPLMVLKQNITKPMIENIEIDVPKKGAKYSRKPSVEVVEGDHKEMLDVTKGQAIVEDAPAQKSNTKTEEIQDAKPATDTKAATEQAKSTSTKTTEQDLATQASAAQTQSTSSTTTEQDSAAQASTAQTQSTSTTTEQDSATQASTAQAQSASTTQTAAQSTASYQPDTQAQSYAPAAETAAYSNTESCTDDSRCATYTENQCADAWLATNCKSKCKLC